MRLNFKILMLTLCLLFVFGCTNGNTQDPPQSDSDGLHAGGRGSDIDEVRSELMVPTFVPMPQGYWRRNPLGGVWIIRFWTTDNQIPPCDMWSTVTHADMGDVGLIMQGSGQLVGCPGDTYAYDFPSHQPLQDLVEYMDRYPLIFFNHSEFVGAGPGKYILPPGTDAFFEFTIMDPNDSGSYFCIAKGIVPGQPVPPEIQHVINELTVWKNEILLHPQ